MDAQLAAAVARATSRLAALLDGGLTPSAALQILFENTDDSWDLDTRGAALAAVGARSSVAAAFEACPALLHTVFLAAVRASEFAAQHGFGPLSERLRAVAGHFVVDGKIAATIEAVSAERRRAMRLDAARFLNGFSALNVQGVPTLAALAQCASAPENAPVRDAVSALLERVAAGDELHSCIISGHFDAPDLMREAVALGYEARMLDLVLPDACARFADAVHHDALHVDGPVGWPTARGEASLARVARGELYRLSTECGFPLSVGRREVVACLSLTTLGALLWNVETYGALGRP